MLTEFDRIVQKIVENLMDLSRVGEDEHILRKQEQFDRNMFHSADALERCRRIFDHLLNIKACLVEKQFFCIKFI